MQMAISGCLHVLVYGLVGELVIRVPVTSRLEVIDHGLRADGFEAVGDEVNFNVRSSADGIWHFLKHFLTVEYLGIGNSKS